MIYFINSTDPGPTLNDGKIPQSSQISKGGQSGKIEGEEIRGSIGNNIFVILGRRWNILTNVLH